MKKLSNINSMLSRNKLLSICSRLSSSLLERKEYPFHISDDEEKERLIVPLEPRPRKKPMAVFEDNMEQNGAERP